MTSSDLATPVPLWTRVTAPFIISVLALMTMIAFESFAITTLLPAAVADLDGAQWYALSYAGTITSALIGMVAGGNWADRSGARTPLKAGGSMFILGIALCALGPNITIFIAGRMLQGIGGGIDSVVLYVLIARHVPAGARPRMFGLLTAAWLLPSLVGPLVAGMLTQLASWRVVFAVVFLGSLASLIGLVLATRPTRHEEREPDPSLPIFGRRGVLTAVAAGMLVVLHLSAQLEMPASALAVAGTLIALGWTVARILPVGTLRLRGVPQRLVVLRAVLGSTVATTEVFLTLYLQTERGFTPTLAGLVIAAGAAGWAAGAWLQARSDSEGNGHLRVIVVATPLVATGPGAALLYTLGFVPITIAVAGSVAMGAGMGAVYPRISSATLALSHDHEHGKYSSALQVGESIATAALLAVAASVLVASGGRDIGFPLIYATLTIGASAAALLAASIQESPTQHQPHELGDSSAPALPQPEKPAEPTAAARRPAP